MLRAIVFFLIPVVIAFLGVVAVNKFKEGEVVRLPAAYGAGTGYAQEAEQWVVSASSKYKWDHGTSPKGWLATTAIGPRYFST